MQAHIPEEIGRVEHGDAPEEAEVAPDLGQEVGEREPVRLLDDRHARLEVEALDPGEGHVEHVEVEAKGPVGAGGRKGHPPAAAAAAFRVIFFLNPEGAKDKKSAN